MATPRKENFLLWMLAAIFAFQAVIFSGALIKCSFYDTEEVVSVCPELGRRYDSTFGVMIATVLALLGSSKSKGSS